MRRALVYSSMFHAAIATVAVVGLPELFDPPPVADRVLTMEVVSADQIAPDLAPEPEAPKAVPEPEPAPEPPKQAERTPPPPPPAPQEIAALPEPVRPDPRPAPEAIPVPQAPEPETAQEPEPVVEPEPESAPVEQQAETPPPPKPAPPRPAPQRPAPPQPDPPPVEKKPEEPQENRLDSLLASLNEARPKPQQGEQKDTDAAQEPAPTPAPLPKAQQTSLDQPVKLSAGEMDALRAQLRRCWNFPAGARNPEDLIVEVRVTMRQDRTPILVEVLDADKTSDSFYRAAADAARRALLNPACHPFKLPQDKFSLWQTMILTFDPREML